MIAYSYIQKNLQFLHRNYVNATSIREANFSSKMAILELCGWIETSMDDVILRSSVKLLRDNSSRQFISEKVKYNYGFEYKKHFKAMVISLVGVSGYERIERHLDPAIIINFKSELTALKERRNSLAHTYTRGITPHYDAPSLTIARFNHISAGLKIYDAELRAFAN